MNVVDRLPASPFTACTGTPTSLPAGAVQRPWLVALFCIAACSSAPKGSGDGGSGDAGNGDAGPDETTCFSLQGGPPPSYEFAPCQTNAGCPCPLSCVFDSNRSLPGEQVLPRYCERPCVSSSDCSDVLGDVCSGGHCVQVTCGDGGVGDPCDAVGSGDGTCTSGALIDCLPWVNPFGGGCGSFTEWSGALCILAGTVPDGGTCALPPGPPNERCMSGELCAPLSFSPPISVMSEGICVPGCDPSLARTSCGVGRVCQIVAGVGGFASGYCVSVSPDGGCIGGLPPSETELKVGPCVCPEQGVVADPSASENVICERPCATSADCPNPATRCVQGFCGFAPCLGDGGLPGVCDFADAGDGTCLAPNFAWTPLSHPFCVAAGTLGSGSTCDPSAVPQGEVFENIVGGPVTPSLSTALFPLPARTVCAPGLLCVATTSDGGGMCQ